MASRYFLFFFRSPVFVRYVESVQMGIAYPAINDSQFFSGLISLPPLAEQHRIVAKVDELMALCDRLEAGHVNAADAHEKLVTHLLATLTASQDSADFNAGWQRIAVHFDMLFTTEASIDALKQTLLQLAVMGKLVPQDPSDEPASALLQRIQDEKARLVSEGKIKKDKPLAVISDDEKPFALPQGWEWSRLEELAVLITKGSSPKWQGVSYTDNSDDVMFVTSENVGSYVLLLDDPKYVEKKFNDIEPRSILEKNDFLMNIVGASIGRTAIYNLDVLANINQAVCLIRIKTDNLLKIFLLNFFNSKTCLEYMFDKQVDNARPNLSMGNISRFLIPIPPVREQHRIVAKVDELMALCDRIQQRIVDAGALQRNLADAMVVQAVA
jgi:type I restriction enzyme S subunit